MHYRLDDAICSISTCSYMFIYVCFCVCFYRKTMLVIFLFFTIGNSLTGSDKSTSAVSNYQYNRNTLMHPVGDNFDMMEYPFLTLTKYPPGFILHIGNVFKLFFKNLT